jgi:co-chaperonin GroES (HSP10)
MSQSEPSADELKRRYNNMVGEDAALPEPGMPTLAEERQQEAQELASRVIGAAKQMVDRGMLVAVGYRVLVKPIESTMGLEAAEMAAAPTLAEQGFQAKTDGQKEREERGENHGVIISMGPIAYERMGGRGQWCDEGDVVVFSRYAGTRVEHPPGSGAFYQLMNDEDIFGKMI